MKKGWITGVALVVVTCLTRIPFATKYVCTHDSVNFALALKEFNIAKHQPHPPGYILYIGLAKFLNLFVKDVNKDLIILSILFSCGAVVLIYLLGKEIFNYRCGFISALFLISSPVFWAYSELALSYIADAFGSLLVAYFGYQVIKGRRQYTLWLSIGLGILAGIRLYLLIFFLPLWVFTLISQRAWRGAIRQVSILIIVCLCWLIPLLTLCGGFNNIRSITLRHYGSAIFPQFRTLKTIAYTIASSLWSVGAIILGLIASIIVGARCNVPLQKKRKELFTFFAIWCGPAFFFVFLIFIGNTGQVLIFLPCFVLLSSIFAYKQSGWLGYIFAGFIIFINCLLFFGVRPLSMGERLLGIKADKVRNFANFWVLDYSNKGLRKKEQIKETLDLIRRNFSSEKAVIAVGSGRSFQPYILWRVADYHLPEFLCFKITNAPQVMVLHLEVDTIVWLIDKTDLQKYKIELKRKFLNGKEIYFSSIEDTLTIGNCKFIKEPK